MTTYSVVHFIEDESVEAVPSCWVKKHFCAWPKNKNCVSKYIQNKHRPNEIDFIFLKARELLKGISKLIMNYHIIYSIMKYWSTIYL